MYSSHHPVTTSMNGLGTNSFDDTSTINPNALNSSGKSCFCFTSAILMLQFPFLRRVTLTILVQGVASGVTLPIHIQMAYLAVNSTKTTHFRKSAVVQGKIQRQASIALYHSRRTLDHLDHLMACLLLVNQPLPNLQRNKSSRLCLQ